MTDDDTRRDLTPRARIWVDERWTVVETNGQVTIVCRPYKTPPAAGKGES